MDDRIRKQPAWVRDHISDLNSRIASLSAALDEARAALTAGPDDSDVFAEMSDVSRPLGKGVDVTFGTGDDTYTVSLRDEALYVDAARDLSIEPVTSFVVVLRMKESR
ncbi:hypothetical protein ABTY20_23115 [Streptomyces sp. NPDC126497]|uniref:DUF7239 family protein n=1 Tax=Streptomyces sp. NPDC126497 TaxID=3155313 RepID=UPI00332EAEE6